MTFDDLNERWKSIVLWYHGMEARTQLKLEALSDSGYSFLIVALIAVASGVLAITLTTWMVKG